MRALTVLASLFALAWIAGTLTPPPATAQQPTQRAGGLKICKATNNAGRIVNWGCQTNQSCCFNTATNTGYCGPVGGGC